MFLSMGGINHQTMGGFLLLCCLLNLFIGLPEGREILFVFLGEVLIVDLDALWRKVAGLEFQWIWVCLNMRYTSWAGYFCEPCSSSASNFLNCCGATHFAARNAKKRTPGSAPTSRRTGRAESSMMWDGEITKTQQVGSWTQCCMFFSQTITWCAHPRHGFVPEFWKLWHFLGVKWHPPELIMFSLGEAMGMMALDVGFYGQISISTGVLIDHLLSLDWILRNESLLPQICMNLPVYVYI